METPGGLRDHSWGVMASRSPLAARLPAVWTLPTINNQQVALENNGPSMLSRHFAALQSHVSPEDRSSASLADVADAAARSRHHASMKHKPSAQRVLEGLSSTDRQETLTWLIQAFDVMHFHDGLLFDAALLLDRYYACLPQEDVRGGSSQRKLLAAVCVTLKLGMPGDSQLPLRQVVGHLGRDQVPFREVLEAELVILSRLRYDVGTPTAREFLEALFTRLSAHRMPGGTDTCRSLAEFLLQLTLVDAPLHYRYPHVVLAAAALVLALHATRASSGAYAALMEDLAVHCDKAAWRGQLLPCITAVHELWVRSVGNRDTNKYAMHLCQKFARAPFHQVSTMVPTASPPTSLPLPASILPPMLQEDECVAFETCVAPAAAAGAADPREQPWTSLASRLRAPVDPSWRVQRVVSRQSWAGSRFRRVPDRDQLLQQLLRSTKGRVEQVTIRDPLRPLRVQPGMPDPRRRSSSWTGHRTAAVVVCPPVFGAPAASP